MSYPGLFLRARQVPDGFFKLRTEKPPGPAKFWIEPKIELARNYDLSEQDLSRALQLVVDREQEIRDAWHQHFDT